jgi:hypothetical protein
MKLHQIMVIGTLKFLQGEHKFHSKKVYTKYPSDEEISEFIDRCTGDELFDLERKTVETKVVELELIEN